MTEDDRFWDLYWELRLQEMETLGKREAILATSKIIRRFTEHPERPVRLLELGCGEGQIIGNLIEGHTQANSIRTSVGIDYNRSSIEKCRRDFPGIQFIEGDFTDPSVLAQCGSFEIVLLINALHEVFSDTFSPELQEVDAPAARQRVSQALSSITAHITPGGYLVLFDGLEPPGDPQKKIQIRFLNPLARENFETFTREYHPFKITYKNLGQPYRVEISQHDFIRYITKSIFLGKQLWQTERLESYQYYTEQEFRSTLQNLGLIILELRTLTINDEKWGMNVEIESPGVDFPVEHILITAQK